MKNFMLAIIILTSTLSFNVNAQENFIDTMNKSNTALLITDPQNDFLKKDGAAYSLVQENIEKLGTIDNIEILFKIAKKNDLEVFISPHIYHHHDAKWQHRGPLQSTMNQIDMFRVPVPVYGKNFSGSGADFLERYKPYILDGKTIITSPHKIYGPESNDLVLQLRKRGIQNVLIGGMAANLCTDSHMRELIENGFNVIMIKDAVGAPGDAAYQAAMTNYSLIANSVITTGEAETLVNNLK